MIGLVRQTSYTINSLNYAIKQLCLSTKWFSREAASNAKHSKTTILKIQEILNSTNDEWDKDTTMIDAFKTTSQLIKTMSEMQVEKEASAVRIIQLEQETDTLKNELNEMKDKVQRLKEQIRAIFPD
ncbi:hypothetical protein C2G38_2251263 [Gigaspora rosea]|uniref:Uncharacterized protein n=1 Tax=Gigaspora rosea TaxID=44941 RepID=A0A397UHG6_9GLOM|nr:hypothetical protein C2G38_2251263 [Gigaspora rosea]